MQLERHSFSERTKDINHLYSKQHAQKSLQKSTYTSHITDSLVSMGCGCDLEPVICKSISQLQISWAFASKLLSGEYHKISWTNTGSGNRFVSLDNRPLREPVLTQIDVPQGIIWPHWVANFHQSFIINWLLNLNHKLAYRAPNKNDALLDCSR